MLAAHNGWDAAILAQRLRSSQSTISQVKQLNYSHPVEISVELSLELCAIFLKLL